MLVAQELGPRDLQSAFDSVSPIPHPQDQVNARTLPSTVHRGGIATVEAPVSMTRPTDIDVTSPPRAQETRSRESPMALSFNSDSPGSLESPEVNVHV